MLRVNGELIDPNLIEETFSRIKAEAETRLQISCCERDPEFMKEAEEEVVDSIVIAQEAEIRYPKMPEDQVRERLEEIIKTYRGHGASWDMLEAQRDQLRDECEANLRMETLLKDLTKDLADPTEEDLRAYYDEHRTEYRSIAEAHCLHLVKFLDRHDDPIALLEDMRCIREKALEGANFEELAKKETEKDSGEIDLDWITLDRPGNHFESMIFTMREKEVSPVVAYEHALHIVQVAELKPSIVTPFEELRDQLKERYNFHHRREALKAFAASLRGDATVEHVDFSGDDDA
jgi:foldase protein PrsA